MTTCFGHYGYIQFHTHTHARTHAQTHTLTHARTHTHTHTLVSQCNGTEEKVFEKRQVFKEDLKELTEVE